MLFYPLQILQPVATFILLIYLNTIDNSLILHDLIEVAFAFNYSKNNSIVKSSSFNKKYAFLYSGVFWFLEVKLNFTKKF